MNKIKKLLHKFYMSFSFGNKLHHNRFWGRLYEKTKLSECKDLESQWSELYVFESGNKESFDSLVNGKQVKLNFTSYTENKYNDIIEFLNLNKDFETFIELGSGWGRNILKLQNHFPNSNYIACELSESGRKITELFSEKYNLNIQVLPFNYIKWRSIRKYLTKKGKTIIFTSYSIEQVSKIDKNFFNFLINNLDNFIVYHIEPVLFQIEKREFPFKEYYNSHYNKNLFSVLENLESEKKIKIIKAQKSSFCFGTNLTSNESAVIIWEKL